MRAAAPAQEMVCVACELGAHVDDELGDLPRREVCAPDDDCLAKRRVGRLPRRHLENPRHGIRMPAKTVLCRARSARLQSGERAMQRTAAVHLDARVMNPEPEPH